MMNSINNLIKELCSTMLSSPLLYVPSSSPSPSVRASPDSVLWLWPCPSLLQPLPLPLRVGQSEVCYGLFHVVHPFRLSSPSKLSRVIAGAPDAPRSVKYSCPLLLLPTFSIQEHPSTTIIFRQPTPTTILRPSSVEFQINLLLLINLHHDWT